MDDDGFVDVVWHDGFALVAKSEAILAGGVQDPAYRSASFLFVQCSFHFPIVD